MVASKAETVQKEEAEDKVEMRSHAEIQKVLRDEIDALKKLLEERFKEIAVLTARLEEPDLAREAEFEARLDDLQARHTLEKTLIEVRHANWQHGSPEGVAPLPQQVEALVMSDFFNEDWYFQNHPDVAPLGMEAAEHYVRSGAFEGRDPGPNFNTMKYYLANPDVAAAGWPALVHYVMFGEVEGRSVG